MVFNFKFYVFYLHNTIKWGIETEFFQNQPYKINKFESIYYNL